MKYLLIALAIIVAVILGLEYFGAIEFEKPATQWHPLGG